MKPACRNAFLTIAAMSVALIAPQALPAQAPSNRTPAANATRGTTADQRVGRRVSHVSRWSAMALRYATRRDG